MSGNNESSNRYSRTPVFVWILLVCSVLAGTVPLLGWSFFHSDALIIWSVSVLIVIYYLFQPVEQLEKPYRHLIMYAGFAVVLLSLLNIPTGFGKPPYSIGDFTLLLSGASIIFFGYYGNRKFILPASLPAIAVVGFQIYTHINQYLATAGSLFVQPVLLSSQVVLDLLGLQVSVSGQYLSFISVTGQPIYMAVTEACSGFWSFGTYTLTVILVILSFSKALSQRGIALLLIGYIGTYCTNVLRVIFIALTGYYTGSYSLMNTVHLYLGEMFFLSWMILFWFYYLTRFLQIPLPSLVHR